MLYDTECGWYKGTYTKQVPAGFKFEGVDGDGNQWVISVNAAEHEQGFIREVTPEDERREAAREGGGEEEDDRPRHPFRTCPTVSLLSDYSWTDAIDRRGWFEGGSRVVWHDHSLSQR